MTISTTAARQGVVSENHVVTKVLMISTGFSFLALAITAMLA
ncbi:MAG: hypothetical protein QNJ29_03805 [Rhizobiaceae bacterium]|nr:hypothetical protein [Rhizobiaceae bacterium]